MAAGQGPEGRGAVGDEAGGRRGAGAEFGNRHRADDGVGNAVLERVGERGVNSDGVEDGDESRGGEEGGAADSVMPSDRKTVEDGDESGVGDGCADGVSGSGRTDLTASIDWDCNEKAIIQSLQLSWSCLPPHHPSPPPPAIPWYMYFLVCHVEPGW